MKKNWITDHYGTIVILLSLLLSAACVPLVPRPAPTRQALSTAQIPSTGKVPAVLVDDQEYDGTTVVVARVVSDGPGWIAIHRQDGESLGPPIGFAKVEDGENTDVAVKIDPQQATPQMYAMLHKDAGVVGKYEFPGPDIPVLSKDGHQVSPPFKALVHNATTGLTPSIVVTSQQVVDGKVKIDEVTSDGPGWVAVHVQQADGTPGTDIGFTAVKAGKNQNIIVTVDPSKVTAIMYAMLHTDGGEVGTYEFPGPDSPVEINGVMVAPSFNTNGVAQAAATATGAPAAAQATATTAPAAAVPGATPTTAADDGMGMVMESPSGDTPSSIKISDQPLENGMVKVDQVNSSGPGWVVIYTTNASVQPDQPIGQVAVKAGQSQNVMVPVDPAKAKGKLYAQLHVDAGKVGTYEFPGPDAPLMVGVQMIASVFQINEAVAAQPGGEPQPTAIVPSITVADQPIKDSAVIIPQVVSNGDAWLVIHRQNGDGIMGAMVGYAYVKNGLNTNVKVKVNTNSTSSTMYAMLHADLGEKGKLEFPGADVPVTVNGKDINPPFRVTYNSESDVVINLSLDTGNGVHLVDIRGMSLYVSLNDTRGKSNCDEECQKVWKPLVATGQIIAGAGVSSDRLGVIILPNGSRQVTYANVPLYLYSKDLKTGDINGQGLNGTWFLANP